MYVIQFLRINHRLLLQRTELKEMGTFFFSEAYVAHVLTGSQDDNKEVRLLVTSYMAHSFMISEVACILDPS